MIDVQLNEAMGKQLMGIIFGAMSYKAVQAKNMEMIMNEAKKVASMKKEADAWNDLSFDMTSRMIDKRFKESKNFLQNGGVANQLPYKKSTTEDDKRFQYIAEQNMLKSRTRFDSAVSNLNKKVSDQKVRASFKLADLKKII